ncbi:MAG: hypothetical protein ACRDU5_14985 [Mycobacterium sp.]
MRLFIRRLAVVLAVAFAPMAFVTVVTPAVSSADCAYGEWWDPVASVCRPVGVQLPKNCGDGWWDPVINDCRPPLVPLACVNGAWWDPAAHVCRPPLIPPPP